MLDSKPGKPRDLGCYAEKDLLNDRRTGSAFSLRERGGFQNLRAAPGRR
jgi:hypothetical protein